jgi:hypothetical protein
MTKISTDPINYKVIEASRTLDATIGLMVLGKEFSSTEFSGIDYDKVPHYSTDGTDALEVLDRLKSVLADNNIVLSHSKNLGWEIRSKNPIGNWNPAVTYNKSFALAICISAIKAFQIDYAYIEKNTGK